MAINDQTILDLADANQAECIYDSYNQNSGLGLDANGDLGVSDDLSHLADNEDKVNRELLAG